MGVGRPRGGGGGDVVVRPGGRDGGVVDGGGGGGGGCGGEAGGRCHTGWRWWRLGMAVCTWRVVMFGCVPEFFLSHLLGMSSRSGYWSGSEEW